MKYLMTSILCMTLSISSFAELAYGASDKTTTLKLVASLDGRVVRLSVSTQDDAPLKNGSLFYTIAAKEIK